MAEEHALLHRAITSLLTSPSGAQATAQGTADQAALYRLPAQNFLRIVRLGDPATSDACASAYPCSTRSARTVFMRLAAGSLKCTDYRNAGLVFHSTFDVQCWMFD